jgi:dGTPase
MDWTTLLCDKRHGTASKSVGDVACRTQYECDVDRIIFSGAFRRLSKKTQVHPFCRNDHVHTRLTHSLEVAQVGRSLGKVLARRLGAKLPTGITEHDIAAILQAACLAHDLGNPPFGHAGEEAISHWFSAHDDSLLSGFKGPTKRDISRFEGNAQGFRILTQTENHLFDGGLRLTSATLAAFCKYPWSSRTVVDNDKFGVFVSEEDQLDEVAKNTGLVSKGKHHWCRHPLAYLTEAADDICYATIDLEDAVELGVLAPKEAYDLLLGALDEASRATTKKQLIAASSYRVNFARMRGPVFDALVDGTIDSFMTAYVPIMGGTFSGELISSLDTNDPRRNLIREAKRVGRERIYTERFKTETELGCFSIFECLLEAFCAAAVECFHHLQSPSEESSMSWKSVLVLRQLGSHAPSAENQPPGQKWSKHLCLRRVLDYVSGMTDNHARDVAEQLRGLPHG